MGRRRILILLGSVSLALTATAFTCTQSQEPLSSREQGFIDHYLLGKWNSLEIGPDGELRAGAPAYEVSLSRAGEARVGAYGPGDDWYEYAGYSTRLKGRKYLNLRVVACRDCDQADRARVAAGICPYQILRYATFMDEGLAAAAAKIDPRINVGRLLENARALRGRLLFVAIMDDEYIAESIDKGLVDGDTECDGCVFEGACLRMAQSELQRFVIEHDAALYAHEQWEWLIRAAGE